MWPNLHALLWRARRLTRETRFLILATDGLWQVMSSHEAVDLAARALDGRHGTLHGAAYALVLEASERWARDGAAADDITVILVLLDASRLPASAK